MAPRKQVKNKRDEIVAAFIESVVSVGLDASSMGEVGTRVNLDRSTMHYYFKTRDELILASADHLADQYTARRIEAMAECGQDDRPRKMIDYLFSGRFHQPRLSIALEEFGTYGNRHPAIDRRIAGIYRSLEKAILTELDEHFPKATKTARRDIGFAISQLLEGYTVFISMGYGPDRARAAHKAALILLGTLE